MCENLFYNRLLLIVNTLDLLSLENDAYCVMDRGYLDFERLFAFNQVFAFFVTRAKSNIRFKRRDSFPVEKATGLRCDQAIILTGFYASKYSPDNLRRVKFKDAGTGKTLIFTHKQFHLTSINHSSTVSQEVTGGAFLQMDQATPENNVFLPVQILNLDCTIL
jgi:hypothetical protein